MMQRAAIATLLVYCASARQHGSAGGLRAVTLGTKGLYGSPSCPCIGLDNVKGELAMATGPGASKTMYPAEAGASCMPWDSSHAPTCEEGTDKNFTKDGKVPEWCHQSWCYVDPCSCNIATLPKVSAYLPDATFGGKPVYYSYETCGGVDAYTEKFHKAACVNQKSEVDCSKLEKCAWDANRNRCAGKEALGVCKAPLDAKKYGEENCRCIGLDNVEGTLEGKISDGTKLAFPPNYGSTCQAFEKTLHPDCKGDKPPAWCDKAWCWVDPCKCMQAEPPRVTAGWLGKTVNYQGKTLYYSYSTCGSADEFTAEYHSAACVNQKDMAKCNALGGKCAWTGTKCIGKELAETCGMPMYSSSWAPTPLSGLLLSLLLALKA